MPESDVARALVEERGEEGRGDVVAGDEGGVEGGEHGGVEGGVGYVGLREGPDGPEGVVDWPWGRGRGGFVSWCWCWWEGRGLGGHTDLGFS